MIQDLRKNDQDALRCFIEGKYKIVGVATLEKDWRESYV